MTSSVLVGTLIVPSHDKALTVFPVSPWTSLCSHSDTLGTLLTGTGVFLSALYPFRRKPCPLASVHRSSSSSSFAPIRDLPGRQKRKDISPGSLLPKKALSRNNKVPVAEERSRGSPQWMTLRSIWWLHLHQHTLLIIEEETTDTIFCGYFEALHLLLTIFSLPTEVSM